MFSQIVKELRQQRDLSYRQFILELNSCLPPEEGYSHTVAYLWEHGKTHPRVSELFYIYHYSSEGSWQRRFAEQGLNLLAPKQ